MTSRDGPVPYASPHFDKPHLIEAVSILAGSTSLSGVKPFRSDKPCLGIPFFYRTSLTKKTNLAPPNHDASRGHIMPRRRKQIRLAGSCPDTSLRLVPSRLVYPFRFIARQLDSSPVDHPRRAKPHLAAPCRLSHSLRCKSGRYDYSNYTSAVQLAPRRLSGSGHATSYPVDKAYRYWASQRDYPAQIETLLYRATCRGAPYQTIYKKLKEEYYDT